MQSLLGRNKKSHCKSISSPNRSSSSSLRTMRFFDKKKLPGGRDFFCCCNFNVKSLCRTVLKRTMNRLQLWLKDVSAFHCEKQILGKKKADLNYGTIVARPIFSLSLRDPDLVLLFVHTSYDEMNRIEGTGQFLKGMRKMLHEVIAQQSNELSPFSQTK